MGTREGEIVSFVTGCRKERGGKVQKIVGEKDYEKG
jgi:hypothetical protein